jgi:hypothetical protein
MSATATDSVMPSPKRSVEVSDSKAEIDADELRLAQMGEW